MLRIVIFTSFILAALFWGDLKNWKEYYPTILFTAICSLFYTLLYDSNPLWRLEPLWPLAHILFNNILISLALTVIVLPSTVLVYLSNYTKGKKQFAYITLWIFIYVIIEFFMFRNKGISYHNGWNLWWSAFFDIALFSLLRIHFLYPLRAWCLSVFFSIFIWSVFGFPMKL